MKDSRSEQPHPGVRAPLAVLDVACAAALVLLVLALVCKEKGFELHGFATKPVIDALGFSALGLCASSAFLALGWGTGIRRSAGYLQAAVTVGLVAVFLLKSGAEVVGESPPAVWQPSFRLVPETGLEGVQYRLVRTGAGPVNLAELPLGIPVLDATLDHDHPPGADPVEATGR